MKIIKKEDRELSQFNSIKSYEYPFGLKNLDCGVILIKGRYPETGWIRNTQVDEMLYCKSGHGRIYFEDGFFDLYEDDAVFIDKNKWSYWDEATDGIFVAVCNPAWSKEQVENRKN